MAMSDPIADLLTRLRNANMVGHPKTEVPASRLREEICRVLKEEGFIQDYTRADLENGTGSIRVYLKYLPDRTPVLQGLRRVSKPSLRVYKKCQELHPVRSGLGIAIMSTSAGVMTSQDARNKKLGGEILCEIW